LQKAIYSISFSFGKGRPRRDLPPFDQKKWTIDTDTDTVENQVFLSVESDFLSHCGLQHFLFVETEFSPAGKI